MSVAIRVHPSVLLSIVDHVTRASLQQQQRQPRKQESAPDVAAASPLAPAFLSTAGLLMGTTKASGAADAKTRDHERSAGGITTTLSASFELPLRLRPDDGAPADVAPSGDSAFLRRVLSDETDWPAARKHCEQLKAVMPEMDVVGCYVVCAGSRRTSTRQQKDGDGGDGSALSIGGAVKKAKGEAMAKADGIVAIARCVQRLLRSSALLPSTATGFVLLAVYDKEVTGAVGETDSAVRDPQQSPAAARLPYDCLYVAGATVSDTLPMAEATVCPEDMEWIALANEAVTPAHHSSLTAAPSASVQPGILRRLCSAAYLASAAETPVAREPTGTQTPPMASWQNFRAAEELVGSLRLIMRLLVMMAASTTNTTVAAPDDVELLRAVATCLRNVPDSSSSQSHGEPTALCAPVTEEVLSVVLALEVQCALRMRSLSKAQQRLLSSGRSATAALHS
ncbi:hypothetical protein JIQ42_07870 [Leishmania sp. Namibia]|uniref:hypothetical protein n=1 Tax=Leishmania sp. Namibia TaxID=2802991 RepID=UPI001B492528|nr:hypothetical protein JIQ42_07870 [Leishmania sp. Namibia]